MPQTWKTQQWPQYWKRSIFIPIPKKSNAKECSNFVHLVWKIMFISHSSKVMLKILQAWFQQYMNRELPHVQAGFRKVWQRNQRSNWHLFDHTGSKEFQKNICFYFFDYTKPIIVWITTNCGKILKIGEYQTTLPASWKTCMWVQKEHLEPDMEPDWFKIGKGVQQGYILSPCLFNFCVEYIIQNARLDESQAQIKTPGRNINNLRYADDTTLIDRKWRGTEKPLDEGERGEW